MAAAIAMMHMERQQEEKVARERRAIKQVVEERARAQAEQEKIRVYREEIKEKVGLFFDSLFAYVEEYDVFRPIVRYGLPPVDFSKHVRKTYIPDGMRIEVNTISTFVWIDIVAAQGRDAELSVSVRPYGYTEEFIANLIPKTIFVVPDPTGVFNASILKSSNDKSFYDCFSTLLKQIAFLYVLQRLTLSNVAEMPGELERDIRFGALDKGWMILNLHFEEKDYLSLNVCFDTDAYCFVRVKFEEAYLDPKKRKESDEEEYCVKTVSDFTQLVDKHRARAQTWVEYFNPFKSMDQKLTSMLTPPALQSALDVDEDGCCVFDKPAMDMTFLLWDCSARDVTMGCCVVEKDSVYVVLRYDDVCGATRRFKGEAWAADAASAYEGRSKARLGEVLSFFTQMRAEKGTLKAHIVYDGQLSVEKDFDLHLHFDHPVEKRSLLVKNVATGSNPLLVIDSFGYGK
jgi:hypothetical protein